MGFEGVVVTDALDMAAVTDNFSTEDTIRMTINAGADMLILPTIMNMSLYDKNIEMTEMAIRLARDGKISMDRIDESVRRILTLKQKYGLLDQTDFNVTEEAVNASVNGIGKAENRETAWEMAEQAVTVYKNDDGAYPVKMQDGQKALILFSDSAAGRAGAGELAKQMLTEKEALPKDADITIMVNTQDNEKKCLKAAKNADHVILVYRTIGADSLDPDTEAGFSSAVFDRVIEERHKAGKKVIFVSCQLPYDAARFPEADAILLTYGSGLMEELPPKTGKNSAYMPNLPAALCACFGQGDANGSLPVTIPSLDKKYRMVVDTMPED
jgi:beta-N-acetylhexosaminidase